MNRWTRRASTTLLVVGVAFLPSSMGAAQDQPQPTQGAVSSLAECSARTGRVAVTFLIDESASLRDTDPLNRRVEAVKAALISLAQLADRTAATAVPVTVDAALVGFGVGSTEVVPWTNITGALLPGLLQASEQFAARNSEIDTDYAAAVLGARDQFSRLPNPTAPSACTAILWFTDGQYDIQPRSTGETKPYAPDLALNGPEAAAALLATGTQLMCGDGGLVDGFRSAGTPIIAVALSSDVAPIAPEDQDFLRAVAEGSAGGARCGAPLAGGAPPPGAYLGTDDVSELTGGFFQVVGNLAGGTPLPSADDVPVCATSTCDPGTTRFVADPGIVSISVLALTSAPGVQLELRSAEPGAGAFAIAPGQNANEAPIGSAAVRWTRVDAGAVLFDVTMPGEQGPWNGEWSLTFVAAAGPSGAVGSARFYVFGDLEPYIEPVQFRAGEENEIVVGLRHRDGSPVDEGLYESVGVEAAVVEPATGIREPVTLGEPDNAGRRSGTWRAPDEPVPVNLTVTARATTASGTELTGVTRTFPVDVLAPSSYPAVRPTELRFGAITGVDGEETVVTVRGGETAGGCAWLAGSAVSSAPEAAGSLRVDVDPPAIDQASCLRVEAGEERELRVRITPSAPASGLATGTLDIVLVSDANAAQLLETVAWEAQMQKVLDTSRKILIWAVLMAIGLAVPLALLWLVNWFTATFDPPSDLVVARVPAIVTSSDQVHRHVRPIDEHINIAPAEFHALDGTRRTRRFDVDGLQLRARAPRGPLGQPTAEVTTRSGAVGSLPPATVGKRPTSAPVPLDLAGTALVLMSDRALATAPLGLDSTIAAALGQGLEDELGQGVEEELGPWLPAVAAGDAGASARRPDLEIELVLFVRASELRDYQWYLDQHRPAITAVVDRLYENTRKTLRAC